MSNHHTAEHVKKNAAGYIATGVVGPFVLSLALGGMFAILDARHEPMGAVKRSEINTIRREIAEKESYLELAPSEVYDVARRVQVGFLQNEILRLEAEMEDE